MSALVTDRLASVETQPELERAGRLVLERMEQLGLNREAAVRASALNRETWKRVERGQRVQEVTYARVEHALRWPEGTMRHIIDGGDPPEERGDLSPQVTAYDREAEADLKALLLALGDADDATQQLMIDTALVAYRAYKRQNPRP